jgi:quercetin dioxygenase-like cupin family protein
VGTVSEEGRNEEEPPENGGFEQEASEEEPPENGGFEQEASEEGAEEVAISVVALRSVEPIELPGGSWSRMLVTEQRVEGNASSIGYSVFKPDTSTASVSHETEEVAVVVSGSGWLETDEGEIRFREGDALHIPPGTWHAVVNDSDDDVVMVFGFPHPDYPPTERR